jgi:hypothetical protein
MALSSLSISIISYGRLAKGPADAGPYNQLFRVSFTVLIAASNHLATLAQLPDLTDAEPFADTDALKALDTITQRRPQVVALERSFAASARGAALINRIKADSSLTACEIRIVEAGGSSTGGPRVPSPAAAPTTEAAVTVAAPPPRKLDQTGTRRAERHVVPGNVEVLIDGNPAILVNISIVGAQVLSISSLRPNQRVRMSLVDATRPMRFNGVIAWASFEMPKEGPRYRAGVSFYDAAPDMVAKFIETVTAT